jgi:type VI secretion system secreted protein VgrG
MTTLPLVRLHVDASPLRWRVASVRGTERVHDGFEFRVLAEPVVDDVVIEDVDIETVVTKSARLSWTLDDHTERTVAGIVEEIRQTVRHFELVIVPRVRQLADAVDHRVFVDTDALTIATTVLSEHGVDIVPRVARALPKRSQCVQAFESDLAFVSRILAEEGVTWFVSPAAPDGLVATDRNTGFDRVDTEVPVVDQAGMIAGRSAFRLRLERRVVTDKAALGDYNFEAPDLHLAAESGVRPDLEAYEFPGGFRDNALGRTLAEIRLEERRVGAVVLRGQTNARDLSAGCIVTLRSVLADVDGEWLVTEVTHEGSNREPEDDGHPYLAHFVAVPASTPYRPARSPAPRMRGVQHATTTGPQGQEIHTEAHGRVKALLRWDRRGPRDHRSSAWTRSMQPPTSGAMFLPRVGWEVLVGFSGTSADQPLVLGRLYNGLAGPPSTLPGNKVVSAFGTRTTPGGGSANLVEMNDSAGGEGMAFKASKDFNERTENDKVTVIAANEHATVGGNRRLSVGEVHGIDVAGAQNHHVGGSRDLNVNANMAIAAGSESISISGARSFKVGGDYSIGCSTLTRFVGAAKAELDIEHETREVGGASTVIVGGTWNAVGGVHASVAVGGASAELVGGAKKVVTGKYYLGVKGATTMNVGAWSIDSAAAYNLGFGAAGTLSAKGSASVKGADIVIAAESKLTIKASGITIEMTPGAVKISGKFDGSVGSVDEGSEKYP